MYFYSARIDGTEVLPSLFILNHATSVDEILMTHPALRQSDVVSTLIFGKVCPY